MLDHPIFVKVEYVGMVHLNDQEKAMTINTIRMLAVLESQQTYLIPSVNFNASVNGLIFSYLC